MNTSLHLPLTAWGLLTRRLSFVLLPALLSETDASIISPIFSRHERSQPYLRVCLPPPLRFSPPPVPPEMADPTQVLGPPNPGGPLEAISDANKESLLSQDHSPKPALGPPLPPAPPAPEPAALPTPATTPASPPPAASPLSIIPDDTPRAIHAEDLLPYFRVPNAPATPLPASSATYQLK